MLLIDLLFFFHAFLLIVVLNCSTLAHLICSLLCSSARCAAHLLTELLIVLISSLVALVRHCRSKELHVLHIVLGSSKTLPTSPSRGFD